MKTPASPESSAALAHSIKVAGGESGIEEKARATFAMAFSLLLRASRDSIRANVRSRIQKSDQGSRRSRGAGVDGKRIAGTWRKVSRRRGERARTGRWGGRRRKPGTGHPRCWVAGDGRTWAYGRRVDRRTRNRTEGSRRA